VRVLSQGERTTGGLYRPQMAIDNTPFLFAEVVEAGHGRITSKGDTVPLIVKKGDLITFFRYASGGEQLCFPDPDDDSKELMLIREAHVTTIVEGMSALVHTVSVGSKLVLQ
jgi:co-chaperonin GroES (HSP10)